MLATVVRTVSVTAAKAGAKAVIRPTARSRPAGSAAAAPRGAVLKAAREALADGKSRLVSMQPEDLLAELGVQPGESRDGVRFARNMCPSKGTMDIFVEPVLPRPSLVSSARARWRWRWPSRRGRSAITSRCAPGGRSGRRSRRRHR